MANVAVFVIHDRLDGTYLSARREQRGHVTLGRTWAEHPPRAIQFATHEEASAALAAEYAHESAPTWPPGRWPDGPRVVITQTGEV